MTEQRLEYANSIARQMNEVKADMVWIENFPYVEKPIRKCDILKLQHIAKNGLESLLSYLNAEFKSL